jgi:hypothetical protein
MLWILHAGMQMRFYNKATKNAFGKKRENENEKRKKKKRCWLK